MLGTHIVLYKRHPGCANRQDRIWLVDLANYLPASARIDGFDIDLTQCPPKEWLPPNVHVHNVDCLARLPQQLLGTYDIVHIQLFHLAVHNNDPGPIIRNLLGLLSELALRGGANKIICWC